MLLVHVHLWTKLDFTFFLEMTDDWENHGKMNDSIHE